MSEPKGNCPTCKNEVDFVVKGSFLFCPNCGHKFEQSDIGAQTANGKENVGFLADLTAAIRLIFIILLVLAGIFLVFLAFLYAACSHMGSI